MRSVNVVDVEPAPQRPRRWSVAEKIRLVEETLQPGMAVSCVARTHGLSPILLFKWRHRQAAGRRAAVRVDDEVIGTTRVRQFEEPSAGSKRASRPHRHGALAATPGMARQQQACSLQHAVDWRFNGANAEMIFSMTTSGENLAMCCATALS